MENEPSNDRGSEPHPQELISISGIPPLPPPLPCLPLSRINPRLVPPTPPLRIKASTARIISDLGKQSLNVSTKVEYLEPPFEPCFLFFYGSLMDPEVLQTIIKLPELPIVNNGLIEGFTVKMWGIYPALIPCEDGEVHGTYFKINKLAHFLRLMEYETSVYTWCSCIVRTSCGETLKNCRTFCWAGDPQSNELEAGSFNLLRYQRYFKNSVVRNCSSAERTSRS
ncbi:hypothetical protein K432DRAFT_380888 [Lepidopterella palustris CBS 459.81]|uniref:Putative gamma-glutamylcyclotransferase n=1 Tax=Lepidopterella palustris CBS 459.81 TaxID=1314670 RepID=A0A8E2JGR2_9PEZI|nr:hypothetical protein K432DRAFT_380888 [Lepidopterella palustris CBS 459.81]